MPADAGSWAQRRCVIPADGYYEWKTEGRQKLVQGLKDAGTRHRILTVPGEHAFMRDEGPRYDPATADQVWAEAVATAQRDSRMVIGTSDGGAHLARDDGSDWSSYFLGSWVRDRKVFTLEEAVHNLTQRRYIATLGSNDFVNSDPGAVPLPGTGEPATGAGACAGSRGVAGSGAVGATAVIAHRFRQHVDLVVHLHQRLGVEYPCHRAVEAAYLLHIVRQCRPHIRAHRPQVEQPRPIILQFLGFALLGVHAGQLHGQCFALQLLRAEVIQLFL